MISNVTLTTTAADTEYSLALPTTVTGLSLVNGLGAVVRYAFKTGLVASPTGNYLSVGRGAVSEIPNLNLASGTIYYASSVAGAEFTLEIET